MRYFGKGVDPIYGFIGAILALAGCLGGNVPSMAGFIAQAQSVGYFQVLAQFDLELIVSVMRETFEPMDLLIYGIATYEGYRFSFRRVNEADIESVAGLPDTGDRTYSPLRMRILLLALLVGLITPITSAIKSASEIVTMTYPSGAKLSDGKIVGGELDGEWTFWHESGQVQSRSIG